MLIIGFVILLVLVGWAFDYIIGFGVVGVVIALLITAALTIGSYWKSDAVALAVSRAKPADPQEYKRLYNLVEGLRSRPASPCRGSTSWRTKRRTHSQRAGTQSTPPSL